MPSRDGNFSEAIDRPIPLMAKATMTVTKRRPWDAVGACALALIIRVSLDRGPPGEAFARTSELPAWRRRWRPGGLPVAIGPISLRELLGKAQLRADVVSLRQRK